MRFQALHFYAMLMLLALLCPAVNPGERDLAALGEKLFHDTRLSGDQSLSCASCHQPRYAFTNGAAVATGIHGQLGERNVPTLIGRDGSSAQFWDMHAPTLEAQVQMVMTSSQEMGADLPVVLKRLRNDPDYTRRFSTVFGGEPTMERVAQALTAFERTLISGETPYDKYVAGDKSALNAEQIRGKDLFFNKFRCAHCHSGANFTDEKLNVRCYPFTSGLVAKPSQVFKTPTLRNLIYTAPYMHNGALGTLEDVVEFYNPSVALDRDGKPIPDSAAVRISNLEKKELVAFLKSLSAKRPFEVRER